MRKRVLVVDDDPLARDALEALLAGEGYEVLTAAGSAAGMIILGRQQVDMVILDLDMPPPDGWSLFAWMRQRPRFRTVPVLIFSGRPPPEGLGEMINQHAPAWLTKGCPAESVLRALRSHLPASPTS